MTKEIFRILTFVSALSPLLPLSFFIIYRKQQPRQHMILCATLVVSLAFDIVGWTMMYFHVSPTPSNNLYVIVSFPVVMAFYHQVLIKPFGKNLVRSFTVVFLMAAAFVVFQKGLYVDNTNTWMLSSVLIMLSSLYFVVDLRMMDDSTFIRNPFHTTNIIINSSLAVYYFASIALFAITDYISTNFRPEDFRTFWIFHDAIYVLKNLGLTLAFYLSTQTHTADIQSQPRN